LLPAAPRFNNNKDLAGFYLLDSLYLVSNLALRILIFTGISATRKIAKSTQASLWTTSARENRHRDNSIEIQHREQQHRDNSQRTTARETTE
jgi:hypothetical protein